MPAALDAAGAALGGARGMLTFAVVFCWLVERSVVGAFATCALNPAAAGFGCCTLRAAQGDYEGLSLSQPPRLVDIHRGLRFGPSKPWLSSGSLAF